MNAPETTTAITVVGTGAEAGAWARALRGVEGAHVDCIDGASDDELLGNLSGRGIDAMAFVAPLADIARAARGAIMARRHVLIAGPVALTSRQLLALDASSRARGRALLVDTGSLGDDRIAFARKMAGGPAALWRPRYLRSLRTGTHPGRTLDELVIADVATVLALIGGVPSRVAAVAPRVDDETGAADVAMMTLMFAGGPVARIDVSLIEPEVKHDVTVACDGRTLVLDACDLRAPLRIVAGAKHHGPQRGGGHWAETVSEHPLAESAGRIDRAAEAFVAAVRAGNTEATNARDVATAARVWETARASIAADGEPIELGENAARPQRPQLRLIQGGGHGGGGRTAPALTLVHARRRAGIDGSPLHSA